MATYHPIPPSGAIRLRRRSASSFDCTNVPALVDWLQARGYRPLRVRSGIEYARLNWAGALIVLYQSGAVVVQGAPAATGLQVLSELEVTA